MRVHELRVGAVVDLGCQRCFDFEQTGRVEAVGWDWAVVRDEKGRLWLLREEDEPIDLRVRE